MPQGGGSFEIGCVQTAADAILLAMGHGISGQIEYAYLYGLVLPADAAVVEVEFDNGQVVRGDCVGSCFALASLAATHVKQYRVYSTSRVMLRHEVMIAQMCRKAGTSGLSGQDFADCIGCREIAGFFRFILTYRAKPATDGIGGIIDSSSLPTCRYGIPPLTPSASWGQLHPGEDVPSMLHVTCDLCGRELRPGEDQRYVVRIEVAAAGNPNEITEADLDDDHMEAVSALLKDEAAGLAEELESQRQRMRFDLCHACQRRFIRDPLSRETAFNFDFSEN
jgi:hypothetical protein